MVEREFQLSFTGRIDPDAIPEIEEGEVDPREAEYAYRVLGLLAVGSRWESVRFQYVDAEEHHEAAARYHPQFVDFYPADEPGEEIAVIDISNLQNFSHATEKSSQLASSIFNDLYSTISPWVSRLRGENFVPHQVERYLHITDNPNVPGQLLIRGFKADLIHELVRELELGTLEIAHFGIQKQVYLRQLAAAAVRLPHADNANQ